MCTIFLYEVLGWRLVCLPTPIYESKSHPSHRSSAFVGIATMLILFPVPGYIGKMVQDVQVQRMKRVLVASSVSVPRPTNIHLKFKTDARVQDVTEGTSHTMTVLHPDVDV